MKRFVLSILSIAATLSSTVCHAEDRNLRENRNKKKDHLKESLRIVAFGTSHTFGASLEDRYSYAYPWRLSSAATNLALRANGPSYPAVCTESMVGDDAIYDVIILEYHLRAQEGLFILAERLRERFPDALIIFFKIWHPFYIMRADTSQNFVTWAKEFAGEKTSLHSKEMKDIMLRSKENDWLYVPLPQCDEAVEEAAKAVGGYVYQLQQNPSPRKAILYHNHWFAEDFHHLSIFGHQLVAEDLAKIINKKARRSDRLGTWSGGDSCKSWFTDGDVGVPFDKSLQVVEFGSGKFSLEIPITGGSFEVVNPFSNDRTLYLTFMVMGPAPSLYPKTRVVVVDSMNQNLGLDVDLDPTSYIHEGHRVHVAKLSKIGVVPPGTITVRLFPLEDTERPFRLTGFSLTNDIESDFEIHR